MRALQSYFLLLIGLCLVPSLAKAEYRRHWREVPVPGFRVHDAGIWRGGRWYHGDYAGHFGWWWIVGNTWHFYPRAYYPYPDPGLTPVYIVEIPGGSTAPVVQTLPYPAPQPLQLTPAPAAPPQPTGLQQPVAIGAPASSTAPIQMLNAAPESVAMPQASAPTASSGAQFYYCSNPRGYYPTVPSCPSGWAASPAPAPQ